MKYIIIPIIIIIWFIVAGFIWCIWYGLSTIWNMKLPNTNMSFLCIEDYILADTPWDYISNYQTWSKYNW